VKKFLKLFFLITPVVISSLLISAHFLRYGHGFFMCIGLVPLIALFVRRPGAARIIQVILGLSTVSWIWTIYTLVSKRVALGAPYTKLIFILGGVAVFTFVSIFVFKTRTLRGFYKL
jgi:hypothetical protein